jgi:hypothetical protein
MTFPVEPGWRSSCTVIMALHLLMCLALTGEDLALEELSRGNAQKHMQLNGQLPPAVQSRLLRAARAELDTAIHLRLPPAPGLLEEDGQLQWSLAPLVQACTAYAACAAVVAAGANASVAVHAWSNTELSSGCCLHSDASVHSFPSGKRSYSLRCLFQVELRLHLVRPCRQPGRGSAADFQILHRGTSWEIRIATC